MSGDVAFIKQPSFLPSRTYPELEEGLEQGLDVRLERVYLGGLSVCHVRYAAQSMDAALLCRCRM